MFKMVNRYGNAVCMASSESERDEFLVRGYHVETKPEKIDLDKMKVDELEKYAEENGIDLSDCNNKSEKLDKIKKMIEK